MNTTKWTMNIVQQEDLHYLVPRFNVNGCLPVWGGDALSLSLTQHGIHNYLLVYTK